MKEVRLNSEKYQFDCCYIYNTETFVMGATAKVLVSPRLTLNGLVANMNVVKNVQISVTTFTDSDIPSTQNFNNLNFSKTQKQELEIEFQIPDKLKSISIQVKGTLIMTSKAMDVDIVSDHKINVLTNQSTESFCQQQLKYSSNGGYEVYLLGKNGEPKRGIKLQIQLFCKQFTRQLKLEYELETDEDGKIQLGELKDVLQVYSKVVQKGDIQTQPRVWNINQDTPVNYPASLRQLPGKTVEIPYQFS